LTPLTPCETSHPFRGAVKPTLVLPDLAQCDRVRLRSVAMPYPIELWLVHPRAEACAAFSERFAGLPHVRVMQTRFELLDPHDCFVTAANGFGLMTAGIDAAVVAFHGTGLMERVQRRIVDEYLCEQPVGTCFLEPTGTPGYPFVGHAPTMRMPGPLDGSDAVYRAAWAALLAVYRHNAEVRRGDLEGEEIVTVAMPAMGTGYGGVDFSEAARQMAAAYRFYLDPPHRLDWDAAIARHRAIGFDGPRRVTR
jgi:O-acetyl-ADP-ribose deacetylase (regulator of RNase III)